MTLPQKLDLNLYRGDTERFQIQIWDDAGATQPADLTGVTFKAEMRDKPGGANLLATFAVSSSAPGVIDVLIDHTTSTALPAAGSWDLQITYASGDVRTLVYGKVKTTMDVTDSVVGVGLRKARAVA
jgi:hypothetical protein